MGGVGRLKVAFFTIDTYNVLFRREVAPSAGGSRRSVIITSVESYPGAPRHHAQLFFGDDPAADTLGSVSNVDQTNSTGHFVFARLPLSDYADIYDVLRSEEPVRFFYEYTPAGFDPQRPSRSLVRVFVGTGEEPLGEGPQDFSPGDPP